jgi:hypothetical protein
MKMETTLQNLVEQKIFSIREIQVMLDSDLAILYKTETKYINRAVKRNPDRFPDLFVFQLTDEEWDKLRCQIGTSKSIGGRRNLPFVFSEQGVAMLSSVLNTETSISVSIQIIKAFVNMRRFLLNNATVFQRIDRLELKQLHSEEKIETLFKALDNNILKADKGIFFNGQVFDAYVFVSEIIKKAQTEIILIDNYIDETVLTLLSKRNKEVSTTIFTNKISQQLLLDLEKHNHQYPYILIKQFSDCHDRFLIIDQKVLYHLGASLKDLGKKWFAFSRMDTLAESLLQKIEG